MNVKVWQRNRKMRVKALKNFDHFSSFISMYFGEFFRTNHHMFDVFSIPTSMKIDGVLIGCWNSEYLANDLQIEGLPFAWDLER